MADSWGYQWDVPEDHDCDNACDYLCSEEADDKPTKQNFLDAADRALAILAPAPTGTAREEALRAALEAIAAIEPTPGAAARNRAAMVRMQSLARKALAEDCFSAATPAVGEVEEMAAELEVSLRCECGNRDSVAIHQPLCSMGCGRRMDLDAHGQEPWTTERAHEWLSRNWPRLRGDVTAEDRIEAIAPSLASLLNAAALSRRATEGNGHGSR